MKGVKIENGLSVRSKGRLVIIKDQEYYRQRIYLAIKMHVNENIWFPTVGINWMGIFQSSVGEDRIIREIRRVIEADAETVSIESLEVTNTDKDNRSLAIRTQVVSIYGKVEVVL